MKYHVVIAGLFPLSHAIASAMMQRVHCHIWAVQDDSEVDRVETPAHDTVIWYRRGRHYCGKNQFEIINKLVAPQADLNDVICILDGDDRLKNRESLVPIRAAYNNPDVLLTHGSYERSSGDQRTFNGLYRANKPFRTQRWHASHLRTFRYKLWRHLPEEAMKRNGEWLRSANDLAMMFPLIEMAGIDRIRYIDQKIYIYNDQSPKNIFRTAMADEQFDNDRWLRGQRPFERLSNV